MWRDYYKSIRTAPEIPYLGKFEGEVTTWDAREIGPEAEIIHFGKGRKNVKTKNREALIGHPKIKCVITNDLDQKTLSILETLPALEHLQLQHRALPEGLNLAGLKRCQFVMMNEVRQLNDLSILTGMKALKSLFVNGPKELDLKALRSLNLKELALWCMLDGNQLPHICHQKNIEYLCVGRFKPIPENLSDMKKLNKLQAIEINSSGHPFEFFAQLDQHLAQKVERNWSLLVRLGQNCPEHNELPLLQASGIRQKPFCELCSPNKLKKLIHVYKDITGKELRIPGPENEQFGFSDKDQSYQFFI